MIIIYIQNNKKAQIKQKRKVNRIQFQSEKEKESKEGKETKQRSFLHFSDSGEREREKAKLPSDSIGGIFQCFLAG